MKQVMSEMAVSLFILIGLALLQTGFSSGNDAVPSNEDCVSRQELAAVKVEMQSQVDQLHSQLHYWQNTTLNILKDHCTATNSNPAAQCCEEYPDHMLTNITQNTEQMGEQLQQLQQVVERLQETQQELQLNSRTGSFQNPAQSCKHILHTHPNTASGDYWLQSVPNYAVQVYCDMERVCGCGGEGGWMRVADINMTRHKENCPAGFRLVTSSSKRMCGRTGAGCVGTAFSSHGVEYSRVCGRVIGYQFGRVNAFAAYRAHNITLDSPFLDGVVLTYGSPRCHIWSFTTAYNYGRSNPSGCPCSAIGIFSGTVPPFIGNDYFCDTGHHYTTEPDLIYHVNDPLWDGAGCGEGNTCCVFNSPPWFCKDLPQSTSYNIELRICGKQGLK